MKVKTGIDVCVESGFKEFKGLRVGLLVHSASVDSNLRYTQDLFLSEELVARGHPQTPTSPKSKRLNVKALFSPEHGLYGTQEYMKEIASSRWVSRLAMTGGACRELPVYSLYGKTLKPTKEMLDEIDIMVVDLQDVGTRYYTYIWTMALTMQACAKYKKKVVVLDRPNPLNGVKVEGPVLSNEFSSFVGLYPIPVRHGMTIGELALMFNLHFKIGAELKVIKMQGWHRDMWFDNTGLSWVMPSPNMPTLDTAIVYPGMCLLEGTNISEGRGTSKPFEFFGAPWLDERKVCDALNRVAIHELSLPGVVFRPVHFIPCADKYKDELCKGVQIHITNRDEFLPFLTGVCIIKIIRDMYPSLFKWREPPYEYEDKKLPFDLLAGNSTIREFIELCHEVTPESTCKILQLQWEKELESFASLRKQYLIY